MYLHQAAQGRVMRGLRGAVSAGILAFASAVAVAALPLPSPMPAPGPFPRPPGLPDPGPYPIPPGMPEPGPHSGKQQGLAPVNGATEAYAFRTRLSSAAICQRFAVEADATFLDQGTDIGAKAAKLEQIETEAKMYNCVTQE